ncbi:hypothetical protein GCM10011490_08280 [Pseudoclavibacter endophyticus]|uniref:Uncharacterized protein n=1 Tax=Pseudoclavibacter endophyticus TaxID=1778590 RepID=A0A6H9WTX1_9MICO|nr:hypothetical protein [Pseudoclavibacter endophyticus]KAB1649700.1 hypothetical protein F8O04_05540 [Pseudoclavibacter endophyticus]GGA60465.1 hypothetical protein GCM10011490_08280 [Pseudoclavibacter endophyticus]
MPAELDPFISRLISRPEWLPTWSNQPWAAIADAGDPAHRRALERWGAVRDHVDPAAYAGIAILLIEAFDDDRALLAFAEATDREAFFEAILPYAPIMAPGGRGSRSVGKLFLTRLLHSLGDGVLRTDIIDAIRHLRIDDRGEVYLVTRRALASELNGTPAQDAAERYADLVLIAAAEATPDRPEVMRTVMSYWGADEPLDDVPTAETQGIEAPASWLATCALIRRSRRAADAERLIELAHDTDFWRSTAKEGPGALDASAYVDGLEHSVADSAEDRLLEIAKADLPVSSRAVAAIARRRARMAGAPPIAQPRVDAVTAALLEAGLLEQEPGPRGAEIIREHATATDSPLDLAALVLGVSGRAITFDLAAGAGPLAPLVTRSLAAIALATGSRRIPFDIDDHEELGAGVEARNVDTGVRVVFQGSRMGAAEFDALVPDDVDSDGRGLQRIRIDADHVTYAYVDPSAWGQFIDWAATTPLPDPAPVPPRRSAQPGGEIGGLLGRLFGRG